MLFGAVVSSGLLQLLERGLSYQGVRIPHWRERSPEQGSLVWALEWSRDDPTQD